MARIRGSSRRGRAETTTRVALEKRPRMYAQEIASMRDIGQRRAALGLVPLELQEQVKTHLRIAWERRRR